MEITTIDLDLAKQVFQVHGVDQRARMVVSKRLRRAELVSFFAGLPPCLVGREACAGAHHWAGVRGGLGHNVRLRPPQLVKPYVKSNKNDARDAEAIGEAVTRPSMRFVPIKGTAQQAVLMMHRVRQLLVRQRTMVASAIGGHLAEFGIVIRQGVKALPRALPSLLQEADTHLPPVARSRLALLSEQLRYFSARVSQLERERLRWHRASEPSPRLEAIGGVGPITATAIVASVGDARSCRSARPFAAWLGRVPAPHSSGGKPRLGSISKRGDTYLRTLLIHGARSSLRALHRRPLQHSPWLARLLLRRHPDVGTVAMAHKHARIIWAMLTSGSGFRPELSTPRSRLPQADCTGRFKVMARQLEPGSAKPAWVQEPFEFVDLIGRRSADSIRAARITTTPQAGYRAAIDAARPPLTNRLANGGRPYMNPRPPGS